MPAGFGPVVMGANGSHGGLVGAAEDPNETVEGALDGTPVNKTFGTDLAGSFTL